MTSEIQNIDKQLFDNLGRRIGMTTLQIAELTGKRHDNIVRKYLTYCDDLGIDHLASGTKYVRDNNPNRVMYVLDYSQTLGLVTGFRNSAQFNATVVRQRIIDEWSKTLQLSAIDLLRQIAIDSDKRLTSLESHVSDHNARLSVFEARASESIFDDQFFTNDSDD